MKNTKKIRSFLRILIILTIAIIADLTYDAILFQAGENFDFHLAGSIVKFRPLFLAVGYLLMTIIGYPLIFKDNSFQINPMLFIIIGIAVQFVMTFRPRGHSPIAIEIYNSLIILLVGRLGLTLNISAIFIGVGIFRLFQIQATRFRGNSPLTPSKQ